MRRMRGNVQHVLCCPFGCQCIVLIQRMPFWCLDSPSASVFQICGLLGSSGVLQPVDSFPAFNHVCFLRCRNQVLSSKHMRMQWAGMHKRFSSRLCSMIVLIQGVKPICLCPIVHTLTSNTDTHQDKTIGCLSSAWSSFQCAV